MPTSCEELASIIGGKVLSETPVCVVQRLRNIEATVLGLQTRSPLMLSFTLSFEANKHGINLNLGEAALLQEEAEAFLAALQKRGIIITSRHNHWRFASPELSQIKWENVGDPANFAKKSIDAAKEAGLF